MNPSVDYQHYLNLVSRSFAFCIDRLNSPLKETIGLSYLLFRILDTIEDAKWSNLNDKLYFFSLFEKSILNLPTESSKLDWLNRFEKRIPDHEKQLLSVASLLFEDLHKLNSHDRLSLQKSLVTMKNGMLKFSVNEGTLRLGSIKEVNQYCFFVAGVIGELLTDFISNLTKTRYSKTVYINSYHFGLFLQKINILKDQSEDEIDGRFLVPNREQVISSIKINANGAINYLINIPLEQKEYRLFCAWSLFLGLSSLPFINSSWTSKLINKIPRAMTLNLIDQVEKLIDNNVLLEQFYLKLIQNLNSITLPATKEQIAVLQNNETDSWLTHIYKGQLGQSELSLLGVV